MDDSKPFKLGQVTVTPNLNTVESDLGSQSVPPKVMKLLHLLLEHQGAPVSQQTILETLWPEQVVSDSSIYQVVAQLRKALQDDKSRGIVERISGKGYRITLVPQPIESEPVEGKPIEANNKPSAANIRNLSVLGIVAVFVLMFFWSPHQPEQNTHGTIQSLTITPLTFETPEQEKLAILVQDNLLTKLVPIKQLTVIQHQENQGEIRSEVALGGRVYKTHGQLNVSVNLTQSDNGQVIWAKLFEVDETFIQESQIADALLRFLDINRAASIPEAQQIPQVVYDDYLLARYLWKKRTKENLQQARQIYERLEQQQVLFPLAAVGLCETYFYLYLYADWTLESATQKCEPLLDEALKTTPQLGQALAARANIRASQKLYDQAQQDFLQAIELAPNYALGHYWYGFLLREQGHYQQSLEKFEYSYQLDPMSGAINLGLAYAHLNLGQIQQARHYYQRSLKLTNDIQNIPVMDLDFYPLTKARSEVFLEWVKDNPKTLEIQPNYVLTNVIVLLSLQQTRQARAQFNRLKSKQVNPAYRLYVEAALNNQEGHYEDALINLKQRYENHGKQAIHALAYATQLGAMGNDSQALELLEQHFSERLYAVDEVNDENSFLLVFWLSLQKGHLSDYQRELTEQLDRYFDWNLYLLAAEWWAFRGDFSRVQAYLEQSETDAQMTNVFRDHLSLWRRENLEKTTQNLPQNGVDS